jgi:hypothetical protein
VTGPGVEQPLIDRRGLDGRFNAQRIRVVITLVERRRPEVDDRVVSRELFDRVRADGRPQIGGPGQYAAPSIVARSHKTIAGFSASAAASSSRWT